MYKENRFIENCNKAIFITKSDNRFNIPEMAPCYVNDYDLCGFNFANSCKDKENKGLHFFVDDYQFQRVWNTPDVYIPMLRRFKYVCSTDFSIYGDFPEAVNIYNHYRNMWLACYWQSKGIKVLPTVLLSPRDFEWTSAGYPKNSDIIISSVGAKENDTEKQWFKDGLEKILSSLSPSKIIVYGGMPEDIYVPVPVVNVESHIDRLHALRKVKKHDTEQTATDSIKGGLSIGLGLSRNEIACATQSTDVQKGVLL